MATAPETRPCSCRSPRSPPHPMPEGFCRSLPMPFESYRHDLPVEADLAPRKPPPQRFGEYLSRLRVACAPPIRSKDGSGGLHDNYGFALAAQPGESQRRPTTNTSSQLNVQDRPARTFVLPAPLSRMVTPYAAIPKTAARHRRRDSHTGYERDRAIARGVQAPDQDSDRAALRRNRRHAVLGAARLRTDHHAQGRRMADPRRETRRSDH